MSWWVKQGFERDATPNDFGPPQELHAPDITLMTEKEEGEYYDLLLTQEEQYF